MKPHFSNTRMLALAAALLTSWGPAAFSQSLTHRYSFNETAGSNSFADSVGGATWNGSLLGNASLDGANLHLDGLGSFASLPSGLIQGYAQVSIEFWADLSSNNPFWTRVFAFGEQNGGGGQLTGLDYCHYAGGNWQNLNLSTTNTGVYVNNPGGLNGRTNVHVTIVVDPVGNRMFYYNGIVVASNPGVNGNGGVVPALSGMNDTLCLIGKSLWDLDATLEADITEFRVYQGAVTPAMVAVNDAAGPDSYVTDPGALQAVHLASPANPLVVNQTVKLAFTGDFANVNGVDLALYGGATFSSGNTSVLTVNSTNGQVTAMTPGTANVVASFGALHATNSLTVVSVPATLAHRYSFAADASDSVGGANGTLMGSATTSGGKVVLDGVPGTYVDLPASIINLPTNQSVTIEAWVDFADVPGWCRLFDFGADGGSSDLYVTPKGPGNGGNHWISENFAGGRTIEWRGAWANVSTHLTFVVDPPTSTLAVYRDGVLEYARYDAGAALSLVSGDLAVLGRSLVGVDPYMPGAIDEFRIYHGALTPQEIALTHLNGVGSTSRDPGALVSINVVGTNYPAFSSMVPPVIRANYANLTGFNLLPNNSAIVNGLVLTSSDTNVVQVLGNNMLTTFRPGTVTLTASYLGKTNSAVITIKNLGSLVHRYSFTSDASDSVGAADGTLQGAASVTAGSLVLDGNADTYVELPAGLLEGYDAVTVDTWVTFNAAQTWARLWYFGDDRANEFYLAPSVLAGSSHWFSTGFPIGGNTITLSPQWENQTIHVTCIYGNGSMEYYTNGVVHGASSGVIGRLSQVGNSFAWIGRSPYADPFMNCSVNEFRIYRGRLSPDEILASDVLGADQLLTTSANLSATVSAGNIVLTWPVSAAGFSVQARADLAAGNWITLTNAPTLIGGNWQVTLPASSGAQLFRLWR